MSGNQTNLAAAPKGEPRQAPGGEGLAVLYQEILTVVGRLRASRKTAMRADAFRSSMKAALSAAEAEATRKGYSSEDARLATFAVVAFLDESVEDAQDPNFADWSRLPMLDELFGERTADETFFHYIDQLLALDDSPPDADVLEIFALCLMLGYRGRYRTNEPEGVRAVITAIAEKVQRIRGPRSLAPDATPPQDAVLPLPRDPWVQALLFGALGALVLAALFFVGYKIALLSGATELHLFSLLGPH